MSAEDSLPRLAGELASDKFHKHIYQLLSHLGNNPHSSSSPTPPLWISNRAVGRVLLNHCLFPYRLCYGRIKQWWWVIEGGVGDPPLTSRLWSLGCPFFPHRVQSELLPSELELLPPPRPLSSLTPWRSPRRGTVGSLKAPHCQRHLRYSAQIQTSAAK